MIRTPAKPNSLTLVVRPRIEFNHFRKKHLVRYKIPPFSFMNTAEEHDDQTAPKYALCLSLGFESDNAVVVSKGIDMLDK